MGSVPVGARSLREWPVLNGLWWVRDWGRRVQDQNKNTHSSTFPLRRGRGRSGGCGGEEGETRGQAGRGGLMDGGGQGVRV